MHWPPTDGSVYQLGNHTLVEVVEAMGRRKLRIMRLSTTTPPIGGRRALVQAGVPITDEMDLDLLGDLVWWVNKESREG